MFSFRKSKIGYTTLRESFQKDDEVRNQKTRSAEPSTTPHPDENDDVCEVRNKNPYYLRAPSLYLSRM